MEKFLDEENDENTGYPAIARLVELGRQKSYVTIDDILHFFPDACLKDCMKLIFLPGSTGKQQFHE